MGSFFPDEPKKLKERISRYRRALKTDLSDGAGKRFLVGPMYLLLGDIDGAIGYYDWYSEAFPDDGPEPFNHLSWALSLYKVGRMVDAATKIRQTMFSNLYLVPHLLGVKPTGPNSIMPSTSPKTSSGCGTMTPKHGQRASTTIPQRPPNGQGSSRSKLNCLMLHLAQADPHWSVRRSRFERGKRRWF